MAQPFPSTLRSLARDSGRAASLGLLALFVAAVAWCVWLFGARIAVTEVSKSTRLEVRGSTYAIHASLAGRLARVQAQLGQTVKRGELIFLIDTAVEEQRLASSKAKLAALDPQIEGTLSELKATRGAVTAEVATVGVLARQAKARSQEATIQAQLAANEAERYSTLGAAAPQIEVERIRAQAEMRKASSAALSLEVRRALSDRTTKLRTGEAKLESLRRELTTLQGEKQALLASVAELEQEIERHYIRAPSDGQLGELMALQAGSYVTAGTKLATVLPIGELMLVAEFEPAAALGRIREQQPAELRLTGFPWLQFGVVPTRVSKVASEPRDGTVRVELELLRHAKSLIPFQHGLPGIVEVTIEHVSPATLLLRSLGRRLDTNTASPSVPQPSASPPASGAVPASP